MNPAVVSVSLLSTYIRQLFENDALLSDLWVEGEVSETFVSRAGHVYFTLRDAESQIKSVLFRGMAQRQRLLPAIGDRIVAHGRVSTYERDGVYQLYVDLVEHAGQGMLALQFELLRQKLESEGLFDPDRKRPLPSIPKTIAVVTSAEGAVWHDIQTVILRRFPLVELILAPAPVQGSVAPAGIVAALERVQFDARAQLVIVARGGGSAEDLACFNDERVARAVFGCRIPVVSAIGHETDWTITDFVADLRAPTPSAAAELCTPSAIDLTNELAELQRTALGSVTAIVQDSRMICADLGRRLDWTSPIATVSGHREEIGRQRETISRLWSVGVDRQRTEVAVRSLSLKSTATDAVSQRRSAAVLSEAVLAALDPIHVLGRGYAVMEREDGTVLMSAAAAHPGDTLIAQLHDGSLSARVNRVDVQPGVRQNA